jgi:hypothetical protein
MLTRGIKDVPIRSSDTVVERVDKFLNLGITEDGRTNENVPVWIKLVKKLLTRLGYILTQLDQIGTTTTVWGDKRTLKVRIFGFLMEQYVLFKC